MYQDKRAAQESNSNGASGTSPGPRTADGTAVPRGPTILLVEDELPIRSLMVRVLEAHGYRVLVATDGQAALSLAADYRGSIDLLVSDVMMPGVDGFTLAERLAELRPETRVLLISGFAEQSVSVQGELKEAGHPFLLKPFTQARLRAAIREQLDT